MRYLTGILATTAILIGCLGSQAAPTRGPALSTPESILAWMNIYHTKPDPFALPAAVKALSQAGALRDPDRGRSRRYSLSTIGCWKMMPDCPPCAGRFGTPVR